MRIEIKLIPDGIDPAKEIQDGTPVDKMEDACPIATQDIETNEENKVLHNHIEDLSVSITSGSISSMEDYRARVGEIQGVTFALDELKALLEKAKYIDGTDST